MTFKSWFYSNLHWARFVVLAAWCLPITLGFILRGDIYQWLLLGTLAVGINLVQWLDILVPRFVRWRRRTKRETPSVLPWWWFSNAKYSKRLNCWLVDFDALFGIDLLHLNSLPKINESTFKKRAIHE